MKFAKLFDIKDTEDQVILLYDVNPEDDSRFDINQTMEVNGVRQTVTMSSLTKKEADAAFESYSYDNAKAIYYEMKDFMENPENTDNFIYQLINENLKHES